MGLIAKQRTKSRIAGGTFPTRIPAQQWMTDGQLRVAAVVRASAAVIGERRKLRSSAHRGADVLGIGTMVDEADSTIWVEQTGNAIWAVSMGVADVKPAALDWQFNVVVNATVDPVSVSVSTPTVLMKDGAQVNKHEYTELRQALLAGLEADVWPRDDGEVALGNAGLDQAPALPFATSAITPFDDTFTITTASSAEHALAALRRRLRFRTASGGPAAVRWLLGLPGSAQPSWIDLTIDQSGRGRLLLRFAVHLAHDAVDELSNIVVSNQARCLADLALKRIRVDDPEASISGGGAVTDGLK